MAVKYPSTCIHCGPCERYARNDVCVTCSARRAAEQKRKRDEARELGATVTDVTTGKPCRNCGEPWRYTVSRKCVTCAESSGNVPKPRPEPKPKPEPKGGYLGKKPKDPAYSPLARATIEGLTWELWERKSSTPGWRNIKLFCIGRNPKKANFWLGWNGDEQRFSGSPNATALTEHYPLLEAFVVAAMNGEDISLLFGGEYCINEQLQSEAQSA